MKAIISLVLFSSCFFVSSDELSKEERRMISKQETEILQTIKKNKKKTSNDKLFYLYLIAARDFHNVNLDDYYLSYLNKAKALKTKEDKSEVYWRLITIHKDDIKKVKALYTEWEKLKFTPERTLLQAFKLIELRLNNNSYSKLSKKEIKDFELGSFSYQFASDRVDQLIKSKKYEKALSFIDPKEVPKQMISTIVRYDLLNGLVHGKRDTDPLCIEKYKKYKHSPSYSIKICKALLEYNKAGKIKKTTLKEVSTVIHMKEFSNESFLYQALLNLNK